MLGVGVSLNIGWAPQLIQEPFFGHISCCFPDFPRIFRYQCSFCVSGGWLVCWLFCVRGSAEGHYKLAPQGVLGEPLLVILMSAGYFFSTSSIYGCCWVFLDTLQGSFAVAGVAAEARILPTPLTSVCLLSKRELLSLLSRLTDVSYLVVACLTVSSLFFVCYWKFVKFESS